MTVDGKLVVRVVIDVLVPPDTDQDTQDQLGELLAERMGDNLDAVLEVNEVMTRHEVERWWVRYEPTGEGQPGGG